MSKPGVDMRSLLDRAREREKLYDWAGAAETYLRIVESLPEGELGKVGDFLELKAYAQYKCALQAEAIDIVVQ